ncbi:MAG TPA: alpha/beta fold hydrolase [Pyrinomonadaceae bacterium]|nr:alpha/beta fold hydrolase [Pyrinomonadaceae bacterium]
MNTTRSKWHDLVLVHNVLGVLALTLSVGAYFGFPGTQSMNEFSVADRQDESAGLVATAHEFVALLAKKDYAGAVSHFDDTMKTAMPQPKLEETWNALLTQAGPFKQQVKSTTEKRGNYTVVHVLSEFRDASVDIRVVLDLQKRVAGLFFAPGESLAEYTPPAYVKTASFSEKEVSVGSGEWALPGTLTMPVGAGPFPAVVLVHGSGPNDRDESIGPNKPFRDLAGGLASQGIAVLRYEKRSRQYGPKLAAMVNATVKEEVTDDALAAVSLLRKTTGIDPKQIYVLGHSLGGMLVPRIGQLDPNISGLISLAGATGNFADVIPEQMNYLASLDGTISSEEQARIDDAKAQANKIKSLKPSDLGSKTLYFGAPAAYWLDLLDYDPPASAKTIKQRLLILQGERDYQVTMTAFQRWKAALATKPNVVFKTYPQLNHLFIAGTGKSTPAEYEQPGHVDERVIQDLAEWIKKK